VILSKANNTTRHAAIDIGTNTALMVIADAIDGHIVSEVADEHAIPRLGEGVYVDGYIQPQALSRTIASLQHFLCIIKGASITTAAAVATAALRRAINQEEVKQALAEALTPLIPLHVIDGKTEGELTYEGVVGNRPNQGVLDIGGGSTEFVWQTADGHLERYSLDIGAVQLTDAWKAGVVPRGTVNITTPTDFTQGTCWQAVAGTPVALALLDLGLSSFEERLVTGYVLNQKRVEYWSQHLLSGTLPTSLAKAIPAARLDILPAGTVILQACMQQMNMPQVTVNTRGLRHGVVQRLALGSAHFTS